MSAYIERPGYDRLWLYFGLDRAAWLTLPRVLMHEMPDDWQDKMATLLHEWDETWTNPPDIQITVGCKQGRKFVRLPEYLTNYRHPDSESIANLKAAK